MFGLSWVQIGVITLAAVFLLGPERIPTVLQWLTRTSKIVRGYAAGAQSELNAHLGPELEELRRQIAELQTLTQISELRDLADLHPSRLLGTAFSEQPLKATSDTTPTTTSPAAVATEIDPPPPVDLVKQ